MASIIRVKRSTGATAPSSLNFGELAITIGAGTQANKGERLFIGDDASPSNIDVIGGKYYTDLMAHAPGLVAGTTNPTTASNGFVAIVDQNRKVDQWNVDDLRLDGNTLSSQTTDADINIDPNGSGEIVIPDDTFLTFGTSKDAKIEYDENGSDKIQVSGADWVYGNTVALTIQDPTQSNNKDTGSIVTEGGLGVEKNVNIGGNLNVTGVGTFVGGIILPPDAALTVGNIGIHSNKIETLAGGGNQLFIDPFPSGTSSEGDVIIKGNLQVDGTTTAVNSTNVTVNDPIMRVGDVTSVRSVMATVSSGANTITVDSVTGLQVADVVAGTSIPNNTTISSINSGTKVITLSANVTAGIATTAQLTVTHAKDTNTDRGISFNYNTSTGISNNKTGFFGYNDSAGEGSSAPARAFTYIPEATVTNEVVTGTRGNLDIKGIYYQTGDFATHGVVYFDSTGLQNSSDAPSSATITSTQILTAVTEVTIALPSALSVVAGDRITQQGGGSQQGVVKATSNTTSITLIGVQGTFTNSNDLVKNGSPTSITPSSAPSVVYTDKPVWTNIIDGGVF